MNNNTPKLLVYIMYNNMEFGRFKHTRSRLLNKFCSFNDSCDVCTYYTGYAPHCYIINIDNALYRVFLKELNV